MINNLKEKIIDSRLKHKFLDSLSDYRFNLEDAYNIQEEINKTWHTSLNHILLKF